MDFGGSLPALLTLDRGGHTGEFEKALKSLVVDLYADLLADVAADVNALGMAHLGSFDLVRREVTANGLALIQGDRGEAATRFLFRMWQGGKGPGKGIAFLQTYLQLLYPGGWKTDQLWFANEDSYPNEPSTASWWLPHLGDDDLFLDGTWYLGENIDGRTEQAWSDFEHNFLSSRVRVYMDYRETAAHSAHLLGIFRAIVPAHIVPEIHFWDHDTIDVIRGIY